MSLKYLQSRLIWDTYRGLLIKISRKKRREAAKNLTQTELFTDVMVTPQVLNIIINKTCKDGFFKMKVIKNKENSLRRAPVGMSSG